MATFGALAICWTAGNGRGRCVPVAAEATEREAAPAICPESVLLLQNLLLLLLLLWPVEFLHGHRACLHDVSERDGTPNPIKWGRTTRSASRPRRCVRKLGPLWRHLTPHPPPRRQAAEMRARRSRSSALARHVASVVEADGLALCLPVAASQKWKAHAKKSEELMADKGVQRVRKKRKERRLCQGE